MKVYPPPSEGAFVNLDTPQTETSSPDHPSSSATIRWKDDDICPREPSEADFALIPQYSAKGSCGNGHLNGHVEVKGGLVFRRDWLARLGVKPDQSAVIYACGESMAPTIGDGYVVLLDLTQTEPRNGLVYAFLLDGEMRIKRFFRAVTGQWRLASDNANKTLYPDEPLDAPLTLSIVGRAVWQGGAL
jgi:phage repressor protein C with HTH and peptisase S24 domain